jgi:hypothetical protein
VATHISDCEKVLQRLEDARLTFSGEKSAFGQSEILVVGHLCGLYGRTGIGWVVNQEGEDGERFPIQFGAKVLSE